MAGLVDIAAVIETVTVAGTPVEVPGISAAGVATLLARFPELRKLMSGIDVSPEDLLKMGPAALAAVLAAGTGEPGNEAAETSAARLTLGDQADLLAAILRVTLPGGLDPFVEKLAGLGLLMDSGAGGRSGKAPALKSRKRSKR